MTGPRVVVTGGTRGIGAALVAAFRETGADVLTCSRTGGDGVVRADVATPAGAAALAAAARDRLGGVDVLVANAGVDGDAPLADLDDAEWHRVLGVNLTGVHHVVHALLPLLAPGASVITVGASAALRGRPTGAHYGASKAGLLGLSRSLAKELGPRGIRVNTVAPGVVADDTVPEHLARALLPRIPLGRFAQPADVVAPVLFLAGDGARYVTGATVTVDGGM